MDYEVLNVGEFADEKLGNLVCFSIDPLCGSINFLCGSVDDTCGSVNYTCADNNCSGGNVFPCENPGFGCRSGCGGAKWTNCVNPKSVP